MMTIEGTFQIGEVTDAVGLSIRTTRHADELGVVEQLRSAAAVAT